MHSPEAPNRVLYTPEGRRLASCEADGDGRALLLGKEAGARLAEAGGCLRAAGEAMAASGANLEAGARQL